LNLVDTIRLVLKDEGQTDWHNSPAGNVCGAMEMMTGKQVGALMAASERKFVGVVSGRVHARKVILQGKSSRQT
jgi:hypothetical protein